jgi:hypothetical protein
MNNDLTLELSKTNNLNFESNTDNIFTNITNAFGKAIDRGIDLFSLPDELSNNIKKGIKDYDYGGLVMDVASAAIKQGMKKVGIKTSSFEDLVQIKEAIVEGDLKKGLSNVLDIVIDNVKLIPEGIKEIIKGGKDRILGTTFDKELDTVLQKQKNTLTRLNKNCDKLEISISENNFKSIDKLVVLIKSDLNKIMPVEGIITRARSLLSENELRTNKQSSLTDEELELCRKLG